MKINKIYKAFMFMGVGLTAPVVAVTASCSTSGGQKAKDNDKTNFDNSVIFQLAQNRFYPLVQPLKDLAKIYNEQEKGKPDFLPVEIQDSDVVKQGSESGLANQVATELEAIKDTTNPSTAKVPNIILGNQAGAFVINQYNRLLDLSKSDIKKDLFDADIYELHNRIPGKESGKIFSIPFDLTTVDALVFNLDIMKLIFDQIKAGGGNVDTNSEIYKQVMNAAKEGKTEIPKDKIWRYMITKDAKAFSGYTVNDSTFASFDKMQEFAKKVFDGLKLNETAIPQEDKAKILKGREAKVLMIDYVAPLFEKALYSASKANIGNTIFGSPENFLWKLSTDAATKKETVDYTYKSRSEKARLNDVLKTTFNKFIKDNAQRDLLGTGTNANRFKSIYYSLGGTTDWASWDVRTYDTAFGIAPHVGTKQSVLDSFTASVFAKNNPEVYKNFATDKDILWKNQVTQLDSTSPKGVFNEGGSALIPISTSDKRNKATIMFIDWLYKGSFTKDGKNISVKDYIRDNSSYVIPTKDRVSYAEYKKLQAEYDKINTAIKSLETKTTKSAEDEKNILSSETRAAILKGALLSLEDLLLAKGINLTTGVEDSSKRIPIAFIANDGTTSKFLGEIIGALIDNTSTQSKGAIKTGEQLVAKVNP